MTFSALPLIVALTACSLGLAAAAAQTPMTPVSPPVETPPNATPGSPTAPAPTVPLSTADAPATPADGQGIQARVIEVHGDASYLPAGATEWKPCRADDAYDGLTQIRTGIGGSLKLQVGAEEPYTAMVIDPVSAVVLSELYKTPQSKRVRVGVGYGRVRAGVAEGGLRSDFTVDSPVATLSKKGTWNFGLYYERGTDRFEIFLLDQGLVDAINKATGEIRSIVPGEAVTNAMRRWGDEAQLRRNISVVDLFGQDNLLIAFNRLRNDGLGVLDPAGGKRDLLALRNPEATAAFQNLIRDRLGSQPPILFPPGNPPPGRVLRPEGFFGTGRGDQLIDVVIDQNNFLARSGFAQPGKMVFRRSALEGWMAGRK